MSHYKIQDSLSEFMTRLTYREYLIRLADLESQWESPDLTQQYLMQIAEHIHHIPYAFSGTKNPSKFEDFKLKFKEESKKVVVPKVKEGERYYDPVETKSIIYRQVILRRLGIDPSLVRVVKGG